MVEIGCGTGLNCGLLLDAVGPGGRIIGVDLADVMLARARRRVERHNWRNVELVQADAATNERTFRAYIRTSLTLFIGGVSLVHCFDIPWAQTAGWTMVPGGPVGGHVEILAWPCHTKGTSQSPAHEDTMAQSGRRMWMSSK